MWDCAYGTMTEKCSSTRPLTRAACTQVSPGSGGWGGGCGLPSAYLCGHAFWGHHRGSCLLGVSDWTLGFPRPLAASGLLMVLGSEWRWPPWALAPHVPLGGVPNGGDGTGSHGQSSHPPSSCGLGAGAKGGSLTSLSGTPLTFVPCAVPPSISPSRILP